MNFLKVKNFYTKAENRRKKSHWNISDRGTYTFLLKILNNFLIEENNVVLKNVQKDGINGKNH